MKKKIFFTLFIFVCAVVLYSQELPYKEIKYKNLNPVWTHSSIDSSLIGVGNHTGRNHFRGNSDTPYPYLISDNYLYISYHTQYSSGEVEGALLEKINLKDGKVMWQQKWDLRNNDRQEWVEAIYFDDQGYLNVVTDRRIRKPFHDNYNVFSHYGDTCLINIRKFDDEDGALIENIGGSKDDAESLRIMNSLTNRTALFPENGHYQYYEMPKSYDTISLYNIDEYGHLISDILIDTIKFEGDVDIHGEGMLYFRKMYKVNQDTLVTLDVLYNKLYPNIDTLTFITVFNKDMEVINRFRIDSLLAYNYKRIYLWYADNDNILITWSKQNNSIRDTFFYTFFNYAGEVERQFNTNYKNKNHAFWAFQYLDDEDEYLIPTPSSHYYGLDFVLTTPYDSVTQIKEFYYEDKNYSFAPRFIKQLENNDIFLFGSTAYFDEKLSIYVTLCPTMMRIKAEDLGLKGTDTKNILINTKTISVSPNPTKSTVTLDFEDTFLGDIEIIDALGRVVLKTKIWNVSKQNIDVSGLIPGSYFIKALDSKKQNVYNVGKFVKE